MARNRDADEDEDDDRPRRRNRNDEDDDDDDLPRRKKEKGWLDRQYLNTSMVVIVIASMCCGIFALAFHIAGVVSCKDPVAKQKATTGLIVSIVVIVLAVIANIGMMLAQSQLK